MTEMDEYISLIRTNHDNIDKMKTDIEVIKTKLSIFSWIFPTVIGVLCFTIGIITGVHL